MAKSSLIHRPIQTSGGSGENDPQLLSGQHDTIVGISPSHHELEALRTHPNFHDAVGRAADLLVEDHASNRMLNKVFNDRGHFLIGILAEYLHYAPFDATHGAGLTVTRLCDLCAETKIGTRARVIVTLQKLRFAGYLRAIIDKDDRRRTLLVPTPKFVEMRKVRWARHFEAMAMVMPEARATMDAWNDMQVQIAVLKQVGDSLRSGMRLGPLAPELEPFFEMTGGLMILLQLLVTSRAGDTPMPCISELASRFGLSRAQVRNILKRARMDGFVAPEKSSRDPIDILPRLADSVDHFMAGSFAYFGRCMRLALAQE